MPTLQEQIDDLKARVDALDGQGLADPSLAVTTVLASKDASLQTTLRQSILTMEQAINAVKRDLAALKTLVNTHLGV